MREAKKQVAKTAAKRNHPDHSNEFARLNRIEGQFNGVRKMIAEGRYCPQIIQQVRATRSALLALEAVILEVHLRHCVVDAMQTKGSARRRNQKIRELLQIFLRAEQNGVGM